MVGSSVKDEGGDSPRDADRVTRARARLPNATTDATLTRMRRVLCDPVRCRIVQALGAGALSVEELAAVVRRPVAGTSQHLRVLRELGVVEAQRVGTRRYYRLGDGGFAAQVAKAVGALTTAAA